jgi:hypothetical protein
MEKQQQQRGERGENIVGSGEESAHPVDSVTAYVSAACDNDEDVMLL